MKIYFRKLLLGCVVVFIFEHIVIGQENNGSALPLSSLIAQLHSSNWAKRSAAYERLRSDRVRLRDPKVRGELVDLLERENKENELALRTKTAGGSDSEAQATYVSELMDTVDSFADWNDTRQVCILISAGASPESSSPAKTARRAKAAIPCVVEELRSDIPEVRFSAMETLVQCYTGAKDVSDPETAKSVKQLIMNTLKDRDSDARDTMVHALGRYGTEEWIPELREVAENDPDPEVEGRSVRKSAARALRRIQERASKK